MSETYQDDDLPQERGRVNGGTISTDDVHALLEQEREATRQLKVQLETERTGRNRAEATATTHATARLDAEQQAVTSRLEAAEANAVALRKAYAEALSEGRYDEAAEIQDNMAETRAKQADDRRYQQWLEAEKQRARQPVQQANDDSTPDLANYSPAQRAWIRKNPEFMTDETIRRKTFAGHQLAQADKIPIDSPEYFALIDQVVHGRHVPDDEDERPAPRRREPPVDMPVTRGGPQAAERQRPVKLTPDEMEAADITNPDVPIQGHKDQNGNWVPGRYEKYAINRQKMRQRGH